MPSTAGFATQFVQTFIPLFVVLDPIGNVPFVVTLTDGMSRPERRRVVHIAMATALLLGLAFLFFGRFILNVLGISIGSFAIAGGLVLLILSIRYILTGHIIDLVKEEMIAVVPIGTPLAVGPGTITLLLVLAGEYDILIVLLALVLNIFLNWLIFLAGDTIARFLGQGGLKAVSKVFSLLLAAIAVTMVLHGLQLLNLLTLPG